MLHQRVVDRVKGTNDFVGPGAARLHALSSALFNVYASYGYVPVETPILERAELYLRKSGPEIVGKTYSFEDQGGSEVSLRPEITASVLRAHIESGQAEPLPRRLSYGGPVFRYERPQRGRFRQFTQHGVELIGAPGLAGDLEVVTLALTALRQLGVANPRLVLGHVGGVASFLEALGLSERIEWFLITNLEHLARSERSAEQLKDELRQAGLLSSQSAEEELIHALVEVPEADAEDFVRRLLSSMNTNLGGSRAPEDIVRRLLAKVRTPSEEATLDRALAFLAEYASISGRPAAVLAAGRGVASRYGLEPATLDSVEALAAGIEQLHPGVDLRVDLGLARGLAYYSGMVFEIYAGDDTNTQLCGGGRYDGLARTLGARQDVPALGFAFGLERLVDVIASDPTPPAERVLVCGDGVDPADVLAAADSLRKEGVIVETDVRERSVRANADYAARAGIRRVLVARRGESGELQLVDALEAVRA